VSSFEAAPAISDEHLERGGVTSRRLSEGEQIAISRRFFRGTGSELRGGDQGYVEEKNPEW